jgi:FkbM family methyltransferase
MTGVVGRLRWLMRQQAFRQSPFRVSTRVVAWEFRMKFGKPATVRFDGEVPIRLVPYEGVSRLTYYFGLSEPVEFAVMDAYLSPGMTVIDVGANIGLHSVFAARRVMPGGRCVSIEPDRYNFRRLQENLSAAGTASANTVAIHAACGATDGDQVQVVHNSRDTARTQVSRVPTPGAYGELAPVISLDACAEQLAIEQVSFLKSDTEGFEEEVLRGAARLLAEHRIDVIQIEINQAALAAAGADSDAISQILHDAGMIRCRWNFNACCFEPEKPGVTAFNSYFVRRELLAPA